MNISYKVALTTEEHSHLTQLISKGKHNSREIKRAHILLLADQHHSHEQIAERAHCGTATVFRVKRQFVEQGLEAALSEGKRPGRSKVLTAHDEAKLVSIACTTPPKGRSQWTLSLLSDKLVAMTDLESVSLETIRNRLKNNELKPWQRKMWCIGNMNAEYIANMEDVLSLYAEAPDESFPVVNFDEAGKQLVSHTNLPLPMKPGQPEKLDYEYKRNGVANIFMFMDRHRGWRKAKATWKKCATDFAECMKELVDEHYPEATRIQVVLDNFGTHTAGSLYKAFAPAEARRILSRLEFHYTPKHASWLNMAEIEIGVMNKQCIDRRIADMETLKEELLAWETKRNEEKASIKWMFDVDAARNKLHRAYDNLRIPTNQN